MIANHWPEMLAVVLCGLLFAGFRLGHKVSSWCVMLAGLVVLPLGAATMITQNTTLAWVTLAWTSFFAGLALGNRCPVCWIIRRIKELRQPPNPL